MRAQTSTKKRTFERHSRRRELPTPGQPIQRSATMAAGTQPTPPPRPSASLQRRAGLKYGLGQGPDLASMSAQELRELVGELQLMQVRACCPCQVGRPAACLI